jgi:hypothetical protein
MRFKDKTNFQIKRFGTPKPRDKFLKRSSFGILSSCNLIKLKEIIAKIRNVHKHENQTNKNKSWYSYNLLFILHDVPH